MSANDHYILKITVDDKGNETVHRLKKSMDQFTDDTIKSSKKVGKSFAGMWKQMALGQLAFASIRRAWQFMKSMPGDIINTAASFETLEVRLKNVLGSAEKARDYFSWIKEFSASTPFQMEDLSKSVIMLENFGINAKKGLSTIGDTSAALNINMAELSQIMGKVFVKPNAQAEEMLQLIERGVPVVEILKEEMGLTADQVANIGNHAVSGTKVFDALMRGVQKRYQGAMKDLSTTWSGLWSTLKDRIALFKNDIAQSGFFDAVKKELEDILNKISAMAKNGELQRWARRISDALVGIFNTIKGIIKFFIKWKDVIIFAGKACLTYFAISKVVAFKQAMVSAFSTISGHLKNFGALLGQVVTNFQFLRARGAGTFGAMKESLNYSVKNMGALGKSVSVVGAGFAGWQIGTMIRQIKGVDEAVQGAATGVMKFFGILKEHQDTTGQHSRDMLTLGEEIKKIGSTLGVTGPHVVQHAQAIYKNKEAYAQLSPEIKAVIDNLAEKWKTLEKVTPESERLKDALDGGDGNGGVKGALEDVQIPTTTWTQMVLHLGEQLEFLKYQAKETDRILQDIHNIELPGAGSPEMGMGADASGSWLDSILSGGGKSKEKKGLFAGLSEGWEKFTSSWSDQSLFEKVGMITQNFGALRGIMDTLGIKSGEVVDNILGMGEGLAKIATGDIVGGVLQVFNSVAGLFDSVFKNKYEKAIDKQNEWMDLTKEQKEQLEDLAKEVGSVHKATSMMLDEFIRDAEITTDNFEDWADRTTEILDDYENGMLDASEAAEEFGDSFSAMLNEARELGMEGSRGMINMIQQARASGLEIKEVTEYVDQQLKSGASALSTYWEGAVESQDDFNRAVSHTMAIYNSMIANGSSVAEAMSAIGGGLDKAKELMSSQGFEASESFQKLINYQNKIEKNQGLVDAISASVQIMEALGNSASMTAQDFQNFETDAISSFDKLKEGGMNDTQALQTLAPMLEAIQKNANAYGFQIDANTQKLIDQANAQGLLNGETIEPQEKMVACMEELVRLMGGEVPYAMEQMAASAQKNFSSMGANAQRFGEALRNGAGLKEATYMAQSSTPAVPSFASGGRFWTQGPQLIQVGEGGEPEEVTIVPRSQKKRHDDKVRRAVLGEMGLQEAAALAGSGSKTEVKNSMDYKQELKADIRVEDRRMSTDDIAQATARAIRDNTAGLLAEVEEVARRVYAQQVGG